MAVLDLITVGEKRIYQVDADPSISGVNAPQGSIAMWEDGSNFGHLYLKYGPLDTDWQKISTVKTNGTVNIGDYLNLPIYSQNPNGNAINDKVQQNGYNINIAIQSQPTRSTAITYQIPNPGNAISSANFVLTEGNQTINGSKTFADPTTFESSVTFEDDVDFLANVDMNSNIISNLGNPLNAQDAATKFYVDSVVQGISWKNSVRAATTIPLDLSSDFEAGDIIDGVTLAAGDRILIKDQTDAKENGIYIVQTSGTPIRALDMDENHEVANAAVFVEEGSLNSDTAWVQVSNNPMVIGTDNLVFTQFAGAGTYTAGNGLQLVGNQFSVKHDGQGLQFVSGDLALELDGTTLSKSTAGLKVADYGITDLQVSASAAISRSKLALGTPNHVLINDHTGAMSSEAQLAMSRGGTNAALVADAGGIVYSGSSALAISSIGSAGQPLLSGGTGAPTWFTATGVVKALSGVLSAGSVDLTSEVSGVLPIANGGTNSGTALNNNRIMVSYGGAIVEAAALTNGQLLIGSTGGAPVAANISGTLNQVNVTNGSGSITLSLPQDIATTSSPSFAGLTLNTFTSGSVLFAGLGGLVSENNTQFFWDNTNGFLGLGTNSPSRRLDIDGSAVVKGPFRMAYNSSNEETFLASVSTVDGTVTDIATFAVPTNSEVLIEARVVGKKISGTGAGAVNDGATYIRTARFKNNAGTVTIHNLQSDYTSEDQAAWNSTMAVSGTNAVIRVQGSANNNMDWKCVYKVIVN